MKRPDPRSMPVVVWAMHPMKDDISPALTWGPVVYINSRYVYSDEIVDRQLPPTFSKNLDEAADSFQPGDYVLLAGDHLQYAYLLARLEANPIKVLRFERQVAGYIPVEL